MGTAALKFCHNYSINKVSHKVKGDFVALWFAFGSPKVLLICVANEEGSPASLGKPLLRETEQAPYGP
jgi:hypothetical protein